MHAFVNLLLWAHFLGLALGLGGGITLSQVGPRLFEANGERYELLLSLEILFTRMASAGLGILVLTGPLLVWLKYGGFGGFNPWFWAKMAFVATALIGSTVHSIAGRRFQRGDRGAIPWMLISGRLTGLAAMAAMLCAVFTFD